MEDPFKEESGKGREDGAPASTPRPSLALALVLGDEGPPGGPPEQPEAALQQSLGAPHRPLRVYLKGRGSAQALLFRGVS